MQRENGNTKQLIRSRVRQFQYHNKRVSELQQELQKLQGSSETQGELNYPMNSDFKVSRNCTDISNDKFFSNDIVTTSPHVDSMCNSDPSSINVIRSEVPELRLNTVFPRHCPVKLNGLPFLALLDSGNLCCNVITLGTLKKLGKGLSEVEKIEDLKQIGTAKQGATLKVLGVLKEPIDLQFAKIPKSFKTRPLVCEGLTMDINISGPFMRKIGLDQLHSKGTAQLGNIQIPLIDRQLRNKREMPNSGVYFIQKEIIPANSAKVVSARIAEVQSGRMETDVGVVLAHMDLAKTFDVIPVPCSLNQIDKEGTTKVMVLNTDSTPKIIQKGARYGTLVSSYDYQHAQSISALSEQASYSKERENQLRDKVEKEFNLTACPYIKTNGQLQAVIDLLIKYREIISFNEEYGKTDLIEHRIDTGDAHPIKLKDRPINPALLGNLKDQLNHWTEQGVIEPSSSPWSFPLIPVVKKHTPTHDSGSMAEKLKVRWCIDFRKLNEMTKKDSYPMPNIEDNLAKLSNSTVFSTLDNVGAFHSVPIRKSDCEKTAFSAGPFGLFQFVRMPFGLTNAPPCYSRLIHKVLQGVGPEIALIFLDDVIVHSQTLETHLRDLEIVFKAYKQAGLKLKPSKCHLFQKEVEYLGHKISEKGIQILPKDIAIVKDWPIPSSLKELRTFLGKMSYYRKFIKGFAAVANPLTTLLAQDHPIHAEQEFNLPGNALQAFKELKQHLTNSPILGYPKFHKNAEPFILDTDWSADPGAIGGGVVTKAGWL